MLYLDEPIYINATDTFTPFPESIMKEHAHKFLDSFLKEREDKYMDELQYTSNNYTLTAGINDIKKFAFCHDFHRESESEFRSRSNFIANIFDADVEFRTDISGWGPRLTAYLRFARVFGESEEQFDNRVYLAHKAFNTYMPYREEHESKNSGRYPWKGLEANFDIYQGINHETGKLQTIVKWNDGEKTIVNCCKYELPLIYPVAYAYCIRRFGSNSVFKKKVKTTRIGDYIYGTLHMLGEHFTASVPIRSKKIDIYDEMAVIIASENYGGILLFEDMCKGSFHKSKED